MRAIEVREFGGPEVLTVIEAEEPERDVVEVSVADTLWLETMVRSGRGRDAFPVTLPYRPGVGVAGTTADGRRVVARLGADGGGYTERVAAPSAGLVDIPDDVDDRTAAALLHDGTTAVTLARLVGIQAGERVLVTAAGGGLGALIVQLALGQGAEVVAAARGEAKLGRLREFGTQAVDYSAKDWTATVGPVDVVLDGAGGEYGRAAAGLVRKGGRYSAHGMPAGGFAVPDDRGLTITGIADLQLDQASFNRAAAEALARAAKGEIVPIVGQTFPLERAADAHRAIEARTAVGKTLLTTG